MNRIAGTRNTMSVTRLFLILTIPCLVHSTMSRVHLTQDGGYKGIVVRIGKDVREEMCQEVVTAVKVNIGWIFYIFAR